MAKANGTTRKRGGTKFPILDRDFRPKILNQCETQTDRGLIKLLFATGMHISAALEVTPESVLKEGKRKKVKWRRPKTERMLQVYLLPTDIEDIEFWAALSPTRKKSDTYWFRRIGELARNAGYDDVSTMTFRHTKCCTLLARGWPDSLVAAFLGCTVQVVQRNYSKMKEDEMYRLDAEAMSKEFDYGEQVIDATVPGDDEAPPKSE